MWSRCVVGEVSSGQGVSWLRCVVSEVHCGLGRGVVG